MFSQSLKFFRLFGLVIFGLALTQQSAFASQHSLSSNAQPREARENPETYFSLEQPQIEEISDAELRQLNPQFSRNQTTNFGECKKTSALRNSPQPKDENLLEPTGTTSSSGGPLQSVEVMVDQIINIGKKIWNIVAAGAPVANFKTDIAHALPRGIDCWNQLSNWSMPTTRTYKITYKNKFGSEVIQFAYQITYIHGGRYGDVGSYITNASILPAHLSVAWGFNFDASAEVPAVFNVGSFENPVGAMQMNMSWKVSNVLTHEQRTESYFISGTGILEKL